MNDIRKPVSHDGHEHIDYVPTQILTEYFRHSFKSIRDVRVDGIIYPSARRKTGRSIVIFAAHKDLNPHPLGWPSKQAPILALDSSSIKRVRR